MDLIVLAEDFYPATSGGAHEQTRFCELATRQGVDVTVFTARQPEIPRRETHNDVSIVRPWKSKPAFFPSYSSPAIIFRMLFSVSLLCYLLYYLRADDIDGVYAASHSLYWVGKVLGTVFGVPYISYISYTPSYNSPEFRIRPKFLLERLNFRLFMGETTFCRSQDIREILADRTAGRAAVIHGILHSERVSQTVDLDAVSKVRAGLGVESTETLLVQVARLVPIKRIEMSLDIATNLPEDYTLIVIGDGPERQRLEREINRRGLESSIRLVGKKSHPETLQTVLASDAMVLTSRAEAYPTVVFEGLALGCRVVATPVGVLPFIKHDRLSLHEQSELPDVFPTETGTHRVDDATVEQFSMERYTDTILEEFEELGG